MQIGGPWGAAAGAVIGGVLGGLGGGAEEDAERLARQQAELIRKTALENQRRAELEMEQVLGGTRAAIAANNMLFTGSNKRYANQLETQFRADIAWDREQSRLEELVVKKGGAMAASQIRASGVASMVAGLGSAAQTGVFGSYSKQGGYTPPWKA
jgi:hypothetical protein